MKGLITGIACFIFLGSTASAQSIYSAQGIGSLNSQGNPSNFAMGGLGIGTPTQWNINTKNPAYLTSNPFSTFEVGLSFNKRKFSGEGIVGSDAGGGLNFLAYAFPIIPAKWSSAFGILPFSSVDFDVFSEGSIEGAPNNATFLMDQKGEGGLTNLFWSNGFSLNKNFSLGLNTSFVFGSINKTSRVAIYEDRVIGQELVEFGNLSELVDIIGHVPVSSTVTIDDLESYKGFNLQLGAAYRIFISDSELLNVGLTLAPKSALKMQRVKQDSIVSLQDETFSLPRSIGVGISYQKSNILILGFDFESQSWKGVQENSTNYQNSTKIILGAGWTPDYDNVNSYFRRVTYSMGFNYQELPYIVNNQGLTEFGINFGASLPVSGYSSFDMAFKVGQLGETNNGLIKETFFKVVIGATINDRWFIKRKYD